MIPDFAPCTVLLALWLCVLIVCSIKASPLAHCLPHIPPIHILIQPLCSSQMDRGQGHSLRLFRLASYRVIFTSLPSVSLSTVKDYSWDMTQAAGCWWCHLHVIYRTESSRRMMCQLHLTPCRVFHTPMTCSSLTDYLLSTQDSLS